MGEIVKTFAIAEEGANWQRQKDVVEARVAWVQSQPLRTDTVSLSVHEEPGEPRVHLYHFRSGKALNDFMRLGGMSIDADGSQVTYFYIARKDFTSEGYQFFAGFAAGGAPLWTIHEQHGFLMDSCEVAWRQAQIRAFTPDERLQIRREFVRVTYPG